MNEFIKTFIASISNLQINIADKDLILKLSSTLVDELNDFNLDLMEGENGMSSKEVLQVSRQYVRNSIYSMNSEYKRKKISSQTVATLLQLKLRLEPDGKSTKRKPMEYQ